MIIAIAPGDGHSTARLGIEVPSSPRWSPDLCAAEQDTACNRVVSCGVYDGARRGWVGCVMTEARVAYPGHFTASGPWHLPSACAPQTRASFVCVAPAAAWSPSRKLPTGRSESAASLPRAGRRAWPRWPTGSRARRAAADLMGVAVPPSSRPRCQQRPWPPVVILFRVEPPIASGATLFASIGATSFHTRVCFTESVILRPPK